MSNPFLLNQGQQKENSGGEGFYLGTVADVSSDGVKILFDGQSEATEKRYKQLNTGITLAQDDRIVAMKISGSYVVLGRIAYNQSGGGGSVDVDDELDDTSENPVQNKVITAAIEDLQDDLSDISDAVGNKVAKTGDTMSGDLVMTGGSRVVTRNPTIDSAASSIPAQTDQIFAMAQDKNNNMTSVLYLRQEKDNGKLSTRLGTVRPVSGSNVWNTLYMNVAADGSKSIDISDPSAWRSALELGAAATKGVDSSPTADSANLVTSGGVKTSVDGKVSKSGDTMTGQLKTSFRSSIAPGCYQPSASSGSLENIIAEIRYSSGCCGSVSTGSAYTLSGVTIPAAWYNYIWIPHRSGGVNGSASGDNCNYGTLYLTGMTGSGFYMVRYTNQAIAEVLDMRAPAVRVSTTAVSSIATNNTGTIQSASYEQRGGIAQLLLTFQVSTAVSSGTTNIATLVSGKRPKIESPAWLGWGNNSAMKAAITTAGVIQVNGQLNANANITVRAVYILA